MKHIEYLIIYENTILKKALSVIDKGSMRIAVVLDKDNKFLGVMNDGDARRAILKGFNLTDKIENIYNKNPSTVAYSDETKEEIIAKAIHNKVYQIPIIDREYKIVDVLDLATLLTKRKRKNKVILMAGGLGTRLRPLTENTPKPLLYVGNKPILETIIENFSSYGFENFIISLNYKSHLIKEYFEDGSKFGVTIEYIEENKRLGTAGALSLLKEHPEESFFVMNGDILTNIDFSKVLDFHMRENSIATMCVREYEYQIPFGVIEMNDEKIESIVEKPIKKSFVNAGIYLMSPESLEYVPQDTIYDMPTLFEAMIEEKKSVLSFPIHEYWMDIGQHHDFEKANEEYYDNFPIKDGR